MDFRLFSWKLTPLLAFAALALVSSVEAQGLATNGWKPIIFSSPDNTEISSNLTSLSTQSSPPANFKSVFQNASPVPAFNKFSPGPAPAPREGRRFQKTSNERQDWVFMTPAEIMGVTPEKMFGGSQTDADSQRKGSLTPMERYLERQNQPARTNSDFFSANDSSSPQGFWGDGNDPTNGSSPNPIGSRLGDLRSTILDQSLNDAPNNNLFANPKGDPVWSKLFGSPAPTPAPGPNVVQQQADMDQFRQLLNPGLAPITVTTISPGGTVFSQSQTILSDSDSTQPLANPVGTSFTPLSSGIGEPASLTPLPGITRQASLQPVTTPAWAPQPAPWMLQTPQPFAVPQRKF
jgi:hypothetical protein